MYRPPYNAPAAVKARLNYEKTWQRLTRLFKDPAPIRPADAPAALAAVLEPQLKTVRVPKLKGNVLHTMKEVMRIFMADWRKAARPINLAIRTTRTGLAKAGGNLDPKTAYRHILALIEHGFLRAKVQVKAGLQLLLNPDLLVFDQLAAPAPVVGPSGAPLSAAAVATAARNLLGGLAAQFGKETARAPKKPYSGIKTPFIG